VGQFDQQFVSDKGGVAWVKQVAASMDPGAVEWQIRGYQQAASKLTEVQKTLQNVKANLAATWTGDAAEQAQQSFQRSINHARATQETITGNVVPTLQGAKATQAAFIAEAAHLPDEKPVPSTNAIAAGFDWVTGQATDTELVESHNIQARSQAAQALNSLSDGYEKSASQLRQAASRTEGGWTGSSSTTGAFELGSVSSSSGNSAASRYSQRVRSGGTTTQTSAVTSPHGTISVVPNPRTMLAGASAGSSSSNSGAVTDTPIAGGSSSATNSEFVPVLIGSDAVESSGSRYNRGGLVSDEPGTNLRGDENMQQERPNSSQGVFDEMGFSDGQSTSGSSNSSNDSPLIEQRTGSGSGVLVEVEPSEISTAGGISQGTFGLGVGGGKFRSSRYLSPSSYLDPVEADGSASFAPVRSAFEDATDALGNPVDMMTAARHRSVQDHDEEDDRGKRPPYLKEYEFWNSAQRVVPPVIQ